MNKFIYSFTLSICTLFCYGFVAAGPLHVAVTSRDLNRVKQIISDSPTCLNAIDESSGYSALALSAYLGYSAIADYLLSQEDIKIDSEGVDKNTPLHVAVDRKNEDLVSTLLDHGANINKKNSKGNTALMIATQGGYYDLFDLLLDKNANPALQNNEKNSALTLAALGNKPNMLKKLIATGINPDSPNIYKNTALSLAADRGHTGIVRILLATKKVSVNRVNEHGFNSLYQAAANNHIEIASLLIDAGGDATNMNEDKTTMLSYAVFKGYEEMVKLLAPLSNLNEQNLDGDTALHLSCHNTTIMRTLILAGANTHIKNNANKTLWGLIKTDKRTLQLARLAQKTFEKEREKKIVVTQQTKEASQKAYESLISSSSATKEHRRQPKPSKRRTKKNKKAHIKEHAPTKKKSPHSTVATFARAAASTISQAISGNSIKLNPADLARWQQNATLVRRKKITDQRQAANYVTYSGMLGSKPYQVELYNSFVYQPTLSDAHRFTYTIDFTQLYSHDITQRLGLIPLLEKENLEHLLTYDSSASIPTLTQNKKFYSCSYDELLQHEKVGQKLDLYHLFELDPRHIQDFGIAFKNTKNDGFTTVEVRIPARMSFTHNDTHQEELGVIELSFPYDNDKTLGPCIHRFMRPLKQVKEPIVTDLFRHLSL